MRSCSRASSRTASCTGNPHIKMTTSIIDYIFRELAITYLGRHESGPGQSRGPARRRLAQRANGQTGVRNGGSGRGTHCRAETCRRLRHAPFRTHAPPDGNNQRQWPEERHTSKSESWQHGRHAPEFRRPCLRRQGRSMPLIRPQRLRRRSMPGMRPADADSLGVLLQV